MSRLILFNKPYDVLCQFTDSDGRKTLADYIPVHEVYAAGRLDKDSEGLVLLTGDGKLQSRIAHPKHKLWKTYWVQVEGVPDTEAIKQLTSGVRLKDGMTKPARVKVIEQPAMIWSRNPPIRFRKNIPDSWLELSIREGKNRQVRRMTAAIGHPTLRLIRYSIGNLTIKNLAPGEWCEVSSEELSLN
ncbi:MAG: pseudouridine synthase [Gammaproteobacteria bacterium]|nr:pseudouridine synthase [Gammaproteobacteria bacterium]MDH5594309.1 pseudouridine synthase [Gammaproteobacteria bacterium]MDH5614300.1 pseudouridine synthase [Gammaproteobacteria bacterium]